MVVIERITGWRKKVRNKYLRVLKTIFNFSLLVMTALAFRSIDVNQLFDLSVKLCGIELHDTYLAVAENIYTPGMLGIAVLFFTDLFFAKKSILGLNKFHWSIKYTWTSLIIILILFLGDNASDDFLYFQF